MDHQNDQKMKPLRVGVFDSGVGGITVLQELRKKFPHVHYIYWGDTAHFPYGTKSLSQLQICIMESIHALKKKNLDALVVACNTASSSALPEMRQVMDPVPVFGVIEPGVQATLSAARALQKRHPDLRTIPVLVLATRSTVKSHVYLKSFEQQEGQFQVSEQSCALLSMMVEEGWIDHPALHAAIEEYVRPHRVQNPNGVALLACTHYPWIQAAFEKALPGWLIVNSAQAVADGLKDHPVFEARESLGASLAAASSPPPSPSPSPSLSPLPGVEWNFSDLDVVPEFAYPLLL